MNSIADECASRLARSVFSTSLDPPPDSNGILRKTDVLRGLQGDSREGMDHMASWRDAAMSKTLKSTPSASLPVGNASLPRGIE